MSGFSKSEIDALFKQYGRENDPRKEIISNLLENTLDETGKIKKIFKYDPNSSGSSLKDFPSLAVAYIEYIFRATTLQQLQSLHGSLHGEEAVKYKEDFKQWLKKIADFSSEKRSQTGKIIHQAQAIIEELYNERKQALEQQDIQKRLEQDALDVTLPGCGIALGTLHPITLVKKRMENLLSTMGFRVLEGPEIEDEFHNFTALNIPPLHPARATTDTFYLENSAYLLRTQTSPVQIRALETLGVPIRATIPGRVYRRDSDATHAPMFHQLEGLMIDEGVTFADLKGILYDFLGKFFNQKIDIRFRPSYFPFTEPSAEVDLKYKNTGWLEVLGCGMVHPNVLKAVNIDNERYTGFAFGMGIDRFAMLYYGIGDLRLMFDNDIRFLEQF